MYLFIHISAEYCNTEINYSLTSSYPEKLLCAIVYLLFQNWLF